jgi:hypothetical protein
VKDGSVRCVLRLAQVLVRFSKLGFEVGPSLLCCMAAAPFPTTFLKEAGVEDEQVGVADDLGSRVGAATGIGEVHCVFDLGEEVFDGLSWVVCKAECLIVGGDIRYCDVAIGLEQMCDKLARSDTGESCMPVLQGTEVDSGDGANELLFQGSVNIFKFAPKAECFTVVAYDDSGVGAGGACWNDGSGPWVCW